MTTFPTPHTVTHRVWSGTGKDTHGNVVPTYTAETVEVYGWAAPAPEERTNERVVVDMRLYAPASLTVDSRDQFELADGHTYTVQGPAQDYSYGPFGWAPGIVVNLERVEG